MYHIKAMLDINALGEKLIINFNFEKFPIIIVELNSLVQANFMGVGSGDAPPMVYPNKSALSVGC